MERMLMEYLVNSMWQVPLFAAGAWTLVWLGRPGPRVQHGVWIVALGLAVVMPAASLRSRTNQRPVAAAEVVSQAVTVPMRAELAYPTADLGDVPSAQASVPPAENVTIDVPSVAVTPKPQGWLRLHEMKLGRRATLWVADLYLAAIAFCLLRLVWSWRVARSMVRDAVPAELSESNAAMLERCCRRLGVEQPQVLVSAKTWSPLVVGVRRPVLVLPENFACGAEGELEAVWWHELVHIARRDYLANLVCRVWMLPVAYHPATHAIGRRVRQTREMVCDAAAAEAMQSPVGYAKCLVGLARRMELGERVGIEGTAMFGGGVLEERVMQLIGTKAKASGKVRVLRAAASAAAMIAVAAAAAVFHVTPTLAEPLVQTAPGASRTAAVEASATPDAVAAQELTPEQKDRIDKQVAEARRRVSEASVRLNDGEMQKRIDEAIKKISSPEFKKQMQEVMKKAQETNSPEMKKQIADALAKADSPEMKTRMEKELKRLDSPESKRQMDEAMQRLNSPEMQKKIADAMKFTKSPEFQKQLTDAMKANQNNATLAAELQRQITEKMNSPEWKKQMDELNSPEFKQRMQELQKKLQDAVKNWESQTNRTRSATEPELNSPEFKKEMLDSQSRVNEAMKAWNDTVAAQANRRLNVAKLEMGPSMVLVAPKMGRAFVQDAAPPAGVSAKAGAIGLLDFQILSDTQSVDFAPYMKQLHAQVLGNWKPLIPEEAKDQQRKSGVVGIVVKIEADGKLSAIKLESSAGVVPMDKAAWASMTAGNLPSLPKSFSGELEVRVKFFYNAALVKLSTSGAGQAESGTVHFTKVSPRTVMLVPASMQTSSKAQDGTQPLSQLPDKDLYERGMGAAASGSYEVERMVLQTLVNRYPDSQYVAQAKLEIAKSWDKQGTAALVEAEDEYQAAGIVPKKIGQGISAPMVIYAVDPGVHA